MTHFEAHLNQANRNIRFFNQVHHQWADWKVVSAYYGALHLVHASLALNLGESIYGQLIANEESKTNKRELTLHKGIIKIITNPKTSQYREIRLSINTFDASVCDDFTELLTLSLKARYLTYFNPSPAHPPNFMDSWISFNDLTKAHHYLQNIIHYLPNRHQIPFPAIESLYPL